MRIYASLMENPLMMGNWKPCSRYELTYGTNKSFRKIRSTVCRCNKQKLHHIRHYDKIWSSNPRQMNPKIYICNSTSHWYLFCSYELSKRAMMHDAKTTSPVQLCSVSTNMQLNKPCMLFHGALKFWKIAAYDGILIPQNQIRIFIGLKLWCIN